MQLATIILAAGKWKRMGESDIPKVMHTVGGKPMVAHVTETALKAGAEKVVIIVGHKRELVINYISEAFARDMDRIEFAVQEEQLGTGHAAMRAQKALNGFTGSILILSGDTPLIQVPTIEELEQTHVKNRYVASLVSGVLDVPFGYGRVLRDASGNFIAIREEKDASEEEKAIGEVNSGMYLVNSSNLFEALGTVRTNNAQGEYYLTDIFGHFCELSLPIGAIVAKNTKEIFGVNTKEQLEAIEKML